MVPQDPFALNGGALAAQETRWPKFGHFGNMSATEGEGESSRDPPAGGTVAWGGYPLPPPTPQGYDH